jgi:hypothetical protein
MQLSDSLKVKLLLLLHFVGILLLGATTKPQTANGLVYFYGYPFNTEQEIQTIANTKYIHHAEISIEWKDVFISKNNFDWKFIDDNLKIWEKEGKKVILRFMTANNATYCTSQQLIDEEKIRMVAEGFFTDFEKDVTLDGYKIRAGKIQGNTDKKLIIEIENNAEINLIQTTNSIKLIPNANYLVQFDYLATRKVDNTKPAFLKLRFQSASKPALLIEREIQVAVNESNVFSKDIKLENCDDYLLYISSQNIASGSIDNLNLIQSSDSRYKRVAFPNYFAPNFKNTFEYFIKQAAIKYATNRTVDAIAISGVGRWEEMLLNDNEKPDKAVHESFYRQWRAYGYSDVNYLKNVVEWSMDVTKKYFPKKELILQISPMNNGYVNEDFIYRRAAAVAISKGVSIKQNGMSEKYDTWSPTSDPAYIMNRYKYSTRANRYYETAGQIFRNSFNAMGHPKSLFNRVAIDGVNYLYLYKADILEPNVQKYFSYFDSIIQKPSFSKLYTQLGEYPLVNKKKRMSHLLDTIMYHNNWLGIRQYNDMDANADYVIDVKTQKKGVKTNLSNSKILFDVDDRVMYNGMSNPVLTVEYLDNGIDAFIVSVLDRQTGILERVAKISKVNSGKFLLKSIPLGHLQDAFDNHKEVKPEIIIDDNKDGFEFISSLEIDFTPINEFKMKIVSESKATKLPLILQNHTDIIQRKISLTVDKPISKAEIVYFDGDFGTKTDIYASLQLIGKDNTTEVSKKQYYIGGDKESITLPVARDIIPQKAILSAYWPKGKVGIYADKGGKMAYRLFCFENEKTTDFKFDNDTFSANCFFNGIQLPETIGLKNIEIKKILQDKSEMNIDFTISGNFVYFQPQTQGHYKVLQNNKSIKPSSICGLVPTN